MLKMLKGTYPPAKPVRYIKGVFSEEECAAVVEKFKNTVTTIEKGAYMDTFMQCSNDHPSRYPKRFVEKLERNIYQMYREYNLPLDIGYVRPYHFTAYSEGASRSWHIDGLLADNEVTKQAKYTHASMTFVVLLNNDFKGGDLQFFEYHNDFAQKAEVGDLIVFPTFVWHKVKKVTKGTRYSLTVFVGNETPLMYSNL